VPREHRKSSKSPIAPVQDDKDEDEAEASSGNSRKKTTASMNPKRRCQSDDTATKELGEEAEHADATPPMEAPRPAAGIGCDPNYLVYQTDHDEVIGAARFGRTAELETVAPLYSTSSFGTIDVRGAG